VVPAITIEGDGHLLIHPTLENLRQLGLAGMARAFEELTANTHSAELDHAEWLGLLLDREIADRMLAMAAFLDVEGGMITTLPMKL